MVTIGEQQTWAAIASMARSLAKIAASIERIVEEEFTDSEPAKETDLPLTKIAWRSEVANGKTEQGFDDWLEGRQRV
jgi:hypothetical protein